MEKIMQATIFDIKHFAVHDGDGIRTTVFFKGCGLKCLWCHNPESISGKKQLAVSNERCVNCGKCANVCSNSVHLISENHELLRENCTFCGKCESICPTGAITMYGRCVCVDDIFPELLEDIDFYRSSGGGVTLSGGECLLQADFCKALLLKLKEHGIHTAVDTCGFVSRAALDKVIPYTDVFLYDLKAIDEEVHKKCTGQSNRIILDNLKYLDSLNKKIEIRIPYVPGHNSGEIDRIARFISELKNVVRVKVLPYHKFAGSKYESLGMTNTLPENLPSSSDISEANEIIKKYVKTK